MVTILSVFFAETRKKLHTTAESPFLHTAASVSTRRVVNLRSQIEIDEFSRHARAAAADGEHKVAGARNKSPRLSATTFAR